MTEFKRLYFIKALAKSGLIKPVHNYFLEDFAIFKVRPKA